MPQFLLKKVMISEIGVLCLIQFLVVFILFQMTKFCYVMDENINYIHTRFPLSIPLLGGFHNSPIVNTQSKLLCVSVM